VNSARKKSALDALFTNRQYRARGTRLRIVQMKRWYLPAAALAVALLAVTTPVDAAPCHPNTSHNCLATKPSVSFSSVPDISKEIVSEEPKAEKPATQSLEAPPITTYTGPMVGIDTMVRAPTVGYYWSLDPDSQSQTH
jgi:hypothetical protein